MFEVNALGTFYIARAAGKVMCDQDEGGSLVTVGDWAIERPYVDHAAYFISKGAIPTLTRVMAVEMASRNPNVRVNCIHPGPIMFPPGLTDEQREKVVDQTLLKKANCPEEVALTVEFLANNRFMTGACLPLDGGRHMFSPGGLEHEGSG